VRLQEPDCPSRPLCRAGHPAAVLGESAPARSVLPCLPNVVNKSNPYVDGLRNTVISPGQVTACAATNGQCASCSWSAAAGRSLQSPDAPLDAARHGASDGNGPQIEKPPIMLQSDRVVRITTCTQLNSGRSNAGFNVFCVSPECSITEVNSVATPLPRLFEKYNAISALLKRVSTLVWGD